jgi:hypothetical protein
MGGAAMEEIDRLPNLLFFLPYNPFGPISSAGLGEQ